MDATVNADIEAARILLAGWCDRDRITVLQATFLDAFPGCFQFPQCLFRRLPKSGYARQLDKMREIVAIVIQEHVDSISFKLISFHFLHPPGMYCGTVSLDTLFRLLMKSEPTGCSKNLLARRKKKFKAEAYFFIREGLNFLQQRSQQEFFNSLYCLSVSSFLDRQTLAVRGVPNLMAAFLVIKHPPRLPQKSLELRKRQSMWIVCGMCQQLLLFGHLLVTILSYN